MKRIGTGAQAKVYLCDGKAIKVFEEGYDKAVAFYEAAVTAQIEHTGLPIARVHEVFEYNGQIALKLDYIDGVSLNDCMLADLDNTWHYLDLMIELQILVHSKEAYLPVTQYGRLKKNISDNPHLSDDLQKRLLSRLDHLPMSKHLCHGDFHGANIIKSDEQYFIIDWIDAVTGHPDGDVCRTYMLYFFYVPEIAETYLDRYCTKVGKDRADILSWLPVVAAARLSEGNLKETEQIFTWISEL